MARVALAKAAAHGAAIATPDLSPPMTANPVEFASLLCSRLCHDLLSPVGALNNGIELLADERDPAMRDKVLELLAESARTTAAKLKFFRLAFGAAGGFGEMIDAGEARVALDGLFAENARLAIGWLVEAPGLPKPAAKALLNLAAVAGEALVRGGRLDIGAEENEAGGLEIVLSAAGPRVALDERIQATLTGADTDPVSSRTAAAALVRTLVVQAGGTLELQRPDAGTLLLGVTFPRLA